MQRPFNTTLTEVIWVQCRGIEEKAFKTSSPVPASGDGAQKTQICIFNAGFVTHAFHACILSLNRVRCGFQWQSVWSPVFHG